MRTSKQLLLHGLAVFAVSIAVVAVIQYASPHIVDYDGYYHIKLAYLMRTEGLKPVFDWLPLTILNAGEFVDHHFLLHVLQIPFTFGDLMAGAKLSAVLFPALAILAVWWLLENERVPHPWLWALGLLVISHAFLYRLSMPRAQSLSLAALALGLHFLLQRKLVWLAVLAGLYVWLFDGFVLIIAVSGAYTAAAWLSERRWDWRPLAYTLVGVAGGLVINPYFPRNLIFIYQHIFPKVVAPVATSVGSEWYPYDTAQLIENAGATLLLLAGAFLLMALTRKQMGLRPTLGLLLVFLFGAMLFQSRRFIEYFPAIVLIFAAFVYADWRAAQPKRWRELSWIAVPILLGFIVGGWLTIPAAMAAVETSSDGDRFAGAASWLEQNTPAGERVFHTDWDDFPQLFFHNHHNTYLVGLDPTYMQLYDPELYDIWVAVTRGQVTQPSGIITNSFDAEYIFADNDHGAFIENALDDPNITEVYRDNFAVIFRIVDGSAD
jgi:hypothetical protein